MKKTSGKMDDFNYKDALEELDRIARKVEDPATALDDIDKLIARSDELIAACRAYLRTARERLDELK
ncbi:MAG: exodeoxyribonuclease VII small subunit [Bacteroidales bacterium]|nr:exodeoxyribonuclease VII small subunit [Bacteroidales bacterium]